MNYINRTKLNAVLLSIATVLVAVSFWTSSLEGWDLYVRIGAIVVLAALLFINYIWNMLYYIVLRHKTTPKRSCPFYTAEQCPYGDKRECKYDTSVCHISKPKINNVRNIGLTLGLLLCMAVSVLAELVIQNQGFWSFLQQNYDITTILKILQPMSNSFIAAVVVYFLIDIPGRLREYQDFFVDLLSSEKHLKLMGEKRLTKLRKQITTQLHVKDFPNMPRGLIDIDERFCEMLKRPYFKTYSQSTTVSSVTEQKDVLRKKVRVEYTAYNPHDKDKAIRFDIGMANSLRFDEEATVEEAKKLYQLNAFSISFDGEEREYNLLPLLRIGVTRERKDGLLYNGRIVLMPRDKHTNEKEPLEKEKLEQMEAEEQAEIPYEMLEDSSLAGLFVSFMDKIRVKFEFEVAVPQDDISYTKRLRYPVKYFTLNYSLDSSVEKMTVVGQIIGTLIDQPDISVEISEDRKSIILKTQNWLLPKNGAMVVHCKA